MEAKRASGKAAFASGIGAAAIATALAFLLRLATGVLTFPELAAEASTKAVPLSLFSFVLDTLGGSAKPVLVVSFAVTGIIIGGLLGAVWLRLSPPGQQRRWRNAIVLAIVLWLLTMLAALPLLGYGFFGAVQPPGLLETSLVYLVVYLAYIMVLAGLPSAIREIAAQTPETHALRVKRRRLLKGIGWVAIGLALAGGTGVGISRLARNRGAPSPPSEETVTQEITPNDQFYAVSKNFLDPVVKESGWKLTVTGLVEKPLELDYAALKALPSVQETATLECISNEIGGSLISNTIWTAVRLRDLLAMAGVKSAVKTAIAYAADGYSDSFHVAKALDPATILVYQMNGEPLPDKHGFPARLVVPGIYGMKNVKWLTKIELVDTDYRGYWQERGWSNEAVIKTMSRIDYPRTGANVPIDRAVARGIAFAGDRGISAVELSTDGGKTWQAASLRKALSPYTWVLWSFSWTPAAAGPGRLSVRAVDGAGQTQSAEVTDTLPDGASGYHSVTIQIVK